MYIYIKYLTCKCIFVMRINNITLYTAVIQALRREGRMVLGTLLLPNKYSCRYPVFVDSWPRNEEFEMMERHFSYVSH